MRFLITIALMFFAGCATPYEKCLAVIKREQIKEPPDIDTPDSDYSYGWDTGFYTGYLYGCLAVTR